MAFLSLTVCTTAMNEATYQLVVDLAYGRVCMDDPSFLLSNDQIELTIPRQLVYLAGLCHVIVEQQQQQQQQDGSSSSSLRMEGRTDVQTQTHFITLQKMYRELVSEVCNESNNNNKSTKQLLLPPSSSMKVYHLSPRLCTEEQKNVVKLDLARKVQELEILANEAVRELSTNGDDNDDDDDPEQSSPSIKKLKGKRRKKKKLQQHESLVKRKERQSRQKQISAVDVRMIGISNDEGGNNNNDDESESSSSTTIDTTTTLEVPAAMHPLQSNSGGPFNDDGENDDTTSGWIEIKRKVGDANKVRHERDGRSAAGTMILVDQDPTSQRTTLDIPRNPQHVSSASDQNDSQIVLETTTLKHNIVHHNQTSSMIQRTVSKDESNTILKKGDDSVVSDATTTSSEQLGEKQPGPVNVDHVLGFDPGRDLSTTTTSLGDEARIRELEELLTVTRLTLQEERVAHARTLQREKERHVDIVQALQLRLYISETRLKTYEDALEDHIQAVANNMSSSSTHHHHHNQIMTTTSTPLSERGVGLEGRSLGGDGSLPSSSLSPPSSATIPRGQVVSSPSLISKALQQSRALLTTADGGTSTTTPERNNDKW